jgi:SecD/SecF fusion protein
MLVGSYLTTDQFSYSYKLGIAYSGGYKVQVDVFNTAADGYDPTIPNGDNEKGLDLLKNKLDPLNNSNLYLQTLGQHGLELTIGKQNFKSYDTVTCS